MLKENVTKLDEIVMNVGSMIFLAQALDHELNHDVPQIAEQFGTATGHRVAARGASNASKGFIRSMRRQGQQQTDNSKSFSKRFDAA